MVTTRIRPDRGLTARMLTVVFLLGAVYAVFVAVLLQVGVAPLLVGVIAGAGLFFQYWFSDRIALFGMNGHVVSREEAPELYGIVERLCALADMVMPKVAIADTDIPNAFATGRNSKRAVVCATTGILRRLDADELEGVLAHELSHVAHRDVAVMTIASFFGVLAGFLTRFLLYSSMFGGFGYGGGDRDDRDNGAAAIFLVMLVSIIVYALSFLLIRALSRYRELAADRGAALITGAPEHLATALVTIDRLVHGPGARIPQQDFRKAEAASALFFAPATRGDSLATLFSTHPSLQERLNQLQHLQEQMEHGQGGYRGAY